MNPVAKHPNATVALASGSGIGTLVAYVLDDVAHLGIPAYACTAIGGGLAAAALFIGRNGIRGVIRTILCGTGSSH